MSADGAWEEYVPAQGRPARDEAIAILSKASSLRLTTKAIELIGNPTHVVLLIDRAGHRVGLRGDNGETSYAFPLRRYGGSHIWNVAIGGFRQWAEIDVSKRTEYPVELVEYRTLAFRLTDSAASGEFEEFRYKSMSLSQLSPNVAISKNGNLTLNHAAREQLGEATRVVLLYNKSRRAIGIRPAGDEERHARTLRKAPTQRTWTLSGEGFLKAYGIPHEEGRSYQPTLTENVLVVDLDNPKPRRRKIREA
jgi:hypothetical protein